MPIFILLVLGSMYDMKFFMKCKILFSALVEKSIGGHSVNNIDRVTEKIAPNRH